MFGVSTDSIINYFSTDYGLIVLVSICILEGLMLLYVMPSELIIPSALFVFGTETEVVVSMILIVVISTTVGQTVLFHIIKSKGKGFLLSSSLIRISDEQICKYERWFDKWGQLVIPVSNSLPFVRGLLTIPAGLSDIGYARFVILSTIGSLVFECIIAILYLAGVEILAV